MRAQKLALNSIKQDLLDSDTLWWKKITKMSDDEIDLLPFSFLKKYGSFINFASDVNLTLKMEENRSFENRWDEIKDLKELQTNEQKRQYEEFIRENTE